jgi:hypothetical protein
MFLHAAVSLVQMDKSVDAFRLFDEVVTEMDGLPTSDTREQALSMALYNKGVILGQMGRIDEEIAVYDELDQHPSMRVPEFPCRLARGSLSRELFSAYGRRSCASCGTGMSRDALSSVTGANTFSVLPVRRKSVMRPRMICRSSSACAAVSSDCFGTMDGRVV